MGKCPGTIASAKLTGIDAASISCASGPLSELALGQNPLGALGQLSHSGFQTCPSELGFGVLLEIEYLLSFLGSVNKLKQLQATLENAAVR